MTARPAFARFARPVLLLHECAAFYRDIVGLDVLAQFEDHDGFSGVVFQLPGDAQFELVRHDLRPAAAPPQTEIVLYFDSVEQVQNLASAIAATGARAIELDNPYWARNEAVAFADPDGCPVILAARVTPRGS